MSIDTQDYSWWYVVRGFDKDNNSYKLASGEVENVKDLGKLWDTEFYGEKCVMGMIDAGGHRAREVGEFVAGRPGMFMYKGRGQLAMRRWEASQDTKRLILANPNIYKAELLYAIYSQENKGNYFWFLPEELDKDYIEQMLDTKPDNKKRDGDKYVNWIDTGNDHMFDCEKMMLVLNEMCLHFARVKKK